MVGISASGPIVRARIGRPIRAAMLSIGDMRFDLTARGEQAVADARTSRRIVAAMRAGEALTLVSTGMRGGRRRQHYLLAGAPSAIDAAIVAALR